MFKKKLILVYSLLTVSVSSFANQPSALPAPGETSNTMALIEAINSGVTNIDWDNDGKIDFIQRYNKQDQITYKYMRLPNTNPVTETEDFFIYVNGGLAKHTNKKKEDRILIEKTVAEYKIAKNGVEPTIKKITKSYCTEDRIKYKCKKFDRQEVVVFEEAGVQRKIIYEIRGNKKKQLSSTLEPAYSFAKNEVQEHFSVHTPQCKFSGNPLSAASTLPCIQSTNEQPTGVNVNSLVLPRMLSKKPCVSGKGPDVLLLKNGFSIDLKSCRTIDPQFNLVNAATGSITNHALSCIESKNPALATQLGVALATQRPVIYCSKDYEVRGLPSGQSVNALVPHERPNQIHLIDVDPSSPKFKTTEELDSIIFHEWMHVANIPHSEPPAGHELAGLGLNFHNLADYSDRQLMDPLWMSLTDPIYACQALCGNSKSNIQNKVKMTEEMCISCISASNNRPKSQDVKACIETYVPASLLAHAYRAQYINEWEKTCKERHLGSDAKTDRKCVKIEAAFEFHFPACKNGRIASQDAGCLRELEKHRSQVENALSEKVKIDGDLNQSQAAWLLANIRKGMSPR